MAKVGLIPFKVQEVRESSNEVPPGVRLIDAPLVWQQGYRGDEVIVAVLDTGCEVDHPDLKDQIVDVYNFTEDDTKENVKDYNGHGTHVAGTIAAMENDMGVVGVAPKAGLLVLKVLDKQGMGQTDWIIKAIKYAVEWRGKQGEKVSIISMSLGGPQDDPALHKAVQEAVAANILVVCAAGNEGDGNDQTDEYAYPGAYEEVVQVGSVNLRGQLSEFSNTNDKIDLVAPGEEILSTYLKGKFAVLSGTSMATPHVAGAAALLANKWKQDYGKDIKEPELYERLISHTVSLGNDRSGEGHGLLKMHKTLEEVASTKEE
ncbi:S8 family peptidase [Priestia filamentosa]|uniref:Serine protease n=1 Tax=Priestia filamentosa TaxID=1402861 RepID=A0A1X7DFQ8_9BACI|nr:S8 family peptidase [Priestia filamentosa]AKO93482.1 serine protease [Priestia filamentosa]MDT3763672.1 S8 family peptidase [Priestia filamentosa]OXS71832.1 serine protease [Priestia filamentosa]RJS63214.1 serine protease [Priestia filamentosa]WRU94102.1 S8 family peptidase [Priestia filamentosa]